MSPREAITQKALELGFDQVGIAAPDSVSRAAEELDRFLAEGRHGEMHWVSVIDKALDENQKLAGALNMHDLLKAGVV